MWRAAHLELFQAAQELVLHLVYIGAQEGAYLGDGPPKGPPQLHELAQALLQGGGELQQAQRVACRGCVKDDAVIVHCLHLRIRKALM